MWIMKCVRDVTPADLLGRPLSVTEGQNAPKTLFINGPTEVPLKGPMVSVVGTRNPSRRGIEDARNVADLLARHGVTVVGGLAAGIDAAAHKAAIATGGRTIAVLGTPLDMAYPPQNQSLQIEIMRNHLAVSQFPSGHPVFGGNFVMRNMTMAMLSGASIIIEAGSGKGTIHHGRAAIKLGRPLLLCGPAATSDHPGLKELVRGGARAASDPDNILDAVFGRSVAATARIGGTAAFF